MPRSQNKVASHRRRKRILEQASGYFGRRNSVYTVAKNAVEKGLTYAFRDRRVRKRDFRNLWITRINAAAHLNGTSYSRLIHAMSQKNITINRKSLAELAVNNPEAFAAIVKEALA